MITIIVAVMNGAKTLRRCIDSVVSQTYPGKELIVIDGGSTDGSVNIIMSYRAQIAYFESEKDNGIYHAWNKGLSHARGDWVCFLGADDFFWDRNVLLNIASKLGQTERNIAYGKLNIVDDKELVIDSIGEPWDRQKYPFLQGVSLPHPALFYRRALFSEHGPFDESFKVAGDYEFLLRELKNRDAEFLPDVVISGMEKGGISLRSTNIGLILNEITAARTKNGVTQFSSYVFFGRVRTLIRSIVSTFFGQRASNWLADLYRIVVGKKRFWTR